MSKRTALHLFNYLLLILVVASCSTNEDLNKPFDFTSFDQFSHHIDSCQIDNSRCLQDLRTHATIPQSWFMYAEANAYIKQGNTAAALQQINQALLLTENENLLYERAKLFELRSSIHFQHNHRQEGADDLYESIGIYATLNKLSQAARTSVEIANLQFDSENYNLAVENAGKAIEFFGKDKKHSRQDSVYMMNCFNTLGLAYFRLKDPEAARINYDKALQLAQNLNEEFWIALINGNSAHIDEAAGNIDEAITKYHTDARISLKYKEIKSAASAYLSIGEIFKKTEKLNHARIYYDSALNLYNTFKINIEPRYYKLMAEWWEAKQNTNNAYLSLSKFLYLRDSVTTERNSSLLQQLQARKVFEKQLADINLLAANNKLKEEEILKREISIAAIVIILMLLLLLIFNFRRSNAVLHTLNTTLESKVKRRTASILKLNQELDTYLYRASHDLRGPILSIQGLVHLMQFSDTQKDIQDLTNKIDHTAKGMDAMLLKLQMAYELNIRDEFEETNIHDLFAAIITTLKERYPKITFEVQCPRDLKIITNFYHLSVAMSNVIENASIFINNEVPVNKVIITATIGNNVLTVKIEDNGIGIPALYHEKIFEAFQRFSTNSTGNGMGLYLAHKALTQLKGKITVTSKEGIGSIFTLSVPDKLYHQN